MMDGTQQLNLFRHVADMSALSVCVPAIIWGVVKIAKEWLS